ncbi:N-6 DNA methylase [Phaeobacter sp. A90a-4k]|uniref:N-6 DNA methylase n=1 Tax=unclassified Phaeobacter TaxID=2621772 RepID=UPI003A8BBACA
MARATKNVDAVAGFVRRMADIDRSKGRGEVFRDFCEMAYCAIAKTTTGAQDRREALEAQYMSVVARYRNKDDVRVMPELFATATLALSTGGCDFFGSVAGELGVLDSNLGQFFTPYELSRLNAEMILGDSVKVIEENGFLTLCEPAAGAGGMVIAAADVLESKDLDPAEQLWVEAVELSRSTFHMCYVQIALRGVAGLVIHGNSLSLEVFERALTPAARLFLARHGDPFAKQKALAAQEAEAEVVAASARVARLNASPLSGAVVGRQLSLFD